MLLLFLWNNGDDISACLHLDLLVIYRESPPSLTTNWNTCAWQAEFRSCVRVEVAVLGSPS